MSRAYIFGLCGLIGALVVGIGEGMLQLQPGSDYGDAGYAYLGAIGVERQEMGYWMSVLAAPLYLLGYIHLCFNLAPHRPRLITVLFLIMAYAFIIATVWMGQRIFIAEAVRSVADGASPSGLVATFSAWNEPLINVLRAAIAIFSLAWVWFVASGQSRYPRWMALFSPAALVGLIFVVYFSVPAIGQWVLPTAMNTAHVLIFALSLLTLRPKRRSV